MSNAGDGARRSARPGAVALGIVLAIALGPAAFPGRAAEAPPDTARGRPSAIGAPRRALIEIGLPRREPAALDGIPHPWPGVATTLTAAGVALPAVVIGRGAGADHDLGVLAAGTVLAVLTPAAGHLYGGLPRRAAKGIIVRSLAASLFLGGVGAARNSRLFENDGGGAYLAFAVVSVAALVGAGSALWEIASVDGDVTRANLRRVGAAAAVPARAGTRVLAVRVRW